MNSLSANIKLIFNTLENEFETNNPSPFLRLIISPGTVSRRVTKDLVAGFGFLSFEDEEAVDRCVAEHFVNLNGKQVSRRIRGILCCKFDWVLRRCAGGDQEGRAARRLRR
jgi:hypothetical protein